MPTTPVADEDPGGLGVVRVHQFHDVVVGVIDPDDTGVYWEVADLDSLEMQPAPGDGERFGRAVDFGKVENRFLARDGPVLDAVGIRGSALREREAAAGVVGSAADVDRVSSPRRADPLGQGGKRAGLGAGIRIAARGGYVVLRGKRVSCGEEAQAGDQPE